MKKSVRAAMFISGVIILLSAVIPFAFAGMLGDVDNDGTVAAADARFVLRASVGLEELTQELKAVADANNDGSITAADARLILRASVGLETLGETGHEHEYEYVVTKAATCTKNGLRTVTCKNCSYCISEIINATGHTMGEWETVLDSTVYEEGYARSTCKNCSYYKDKAISVKEAVYYITVDRGIGDVIKTGIASDGKYKLTAPVREGYSFKGWLDAGGNEFPSEGVISSDVSVSAVWAIAPTDSFYKLEKRAAAGAKEIVITSDIIVTGPIYVPYETHIYSDGEHSLIRSPGYAGDIFVVGSDENGVKSCDIGVKAKLTLGGEEGVLTVDGNRDNITVQVNGALVFVADSSEFELYDGARLINNLKTANDRISGYLSIFSVDSMERVGGAAVINVASVFCMYGGEIENNEVAMEYTVRDNGDGTTSQYETAGCGGGVYNRGTFRMYAGVIGRNSALRGGGIYNDRYCFLYSGEISGNNASVYGAALSSSSSMNADTFVGSDEETDAVMLIKDNHSLRAGGAMYSNTSSPIMIYSNAQFVNNRSDTSGGAVYTAGPLVIDGAEFIGNTCEYSGGAIYHHYQKAEYKRKYLQLTDCYFEGNEAGLGGAVILSSGGSVTDEGTYAEIKNCSFVKNKAVVTELNPGNGGALYITRSSDAIIKDCSFTENTATNNAGALAIHSNATLDISDCTFSKNEAVFGGALYTSSESVVSMKNIEFSENKAIMNETLSGGNGGALYYSKATLTLKNVDFINNSAENHAGAIYQNASVINLDSTCEFTGNSAGNHGGAIYLTYSNNEDGTKTGSVIKAENVTFKNNSALAGGAISGRSATDITLNKVSFIGNSTPDATVSTTTGGGAVYSNNSDVKITDTVFDGNTSGYYGGALRLDSCVTEIKSSQIINSSGGTGGAIYATGQTLNADDLTLKDNSSSLNGVIYLTCKEAVFNNLTATGNTAVNGGAVMVGRNSQVNISDSVFSSNTAKYGGALYVKENGKIVSEGCQFTQNSSSSYGGAVYVFGASFEATKNSSFTKNTAGGHGGAISSADIQDEVTLEKTYSQVNINGCSFDENTGSSGGAVYFNDSVYTVEDCSFTNNTATNESYGGGAVYNTGATGKISNVTFTGNTALRGGAVAMYTESSVEFSDISASGNEATAEGGVIYSNKCSLDLTNDNLVFTGNKAKYGGAVYATSVEKVDIKNAVLQGNKATVNGGALYAAGTVVNISGENTVISGNEAGEHGGAVYLSYVTQADSVKKGGVLNIDGVTVSDNSALFGGAVSGRTNSVINITDSTLSGNSTPDATSSNKAGGGAIYTNNSELKLSNVRLEGNSSGYYGGAVFTDVTQVNINNGSVISGNNGGTGAALYLTTGSSLEAENITVENNQASVNGILYLNGKTFNLRGVTARNNIAASSGGVIYTGGAAEVNIADCVFTGNTASTGGAIYHRSTNELTLSNTCFTDNAASSNGGAIDIVGSTLTATGENEFTGNTANGHGGAVYVTYIAPEGENQGRYGKFVMTGGIFEGNSAVGGGAVSIRSDCEAEFNETEFIRNSVTGYEIKSDGSGSPDGNAEGGGAIYVGYGSLTLNNVTAKENEAKESLAEDNTVIKSFGGAVAAVKSQITVAAGTYENNKASLGGAFNIIDKSDASFTGTVLQSNESVYVNKDYDNTVGGGAVSAKSSTLSFDNITLSENKTGYYGGALMADSSTVDIFNNSIIESNKGATGAAVHFKNNSVVTVTDSVISNNKADYNGVFYANNSNITLERVNATENEAVNGGVIFVSNAKTVVNVKSSTLNENSASSRGGAVYAENATVIFNESEVSGNTSSSGGAVYTNGGKISLTGGEVSSNTASNGGAVYGLENAQVSISGTVLDENSASRNGGAVYVSTSEAAFTDAQFTSNSANNHGGALYLAGSTVSAEGNNSFTDNSASNHAGAVYVVYTDIENEDGTKTRVPTVMTMNGGSFTGNTALGGGAVSIRTGCEATFTDTVFTENSVKGFADEADGDGEGGGAFYVGFGTLNLNNVTANGNNAEEGTDATDGTVIKSFGGAVDLYNANVNVSGGTFENNTASAGGAFYASGASSVNIAGATLKNNESVYANSDYDTNMGGGAVNISGGSLTLDNAVLSGNKTDYYGGAVIASGTTADIKGGSIIENSEGGTGAALYFKNSSTVTVNGAVVKNNISTANGVIYVNNSKLYATGLEASGNKARNGGAIYVSHNNSVVDVSDSIFSDNTATALGGTVYSEDAAVSISSSEFSGNTAKNGGAAYSLRGKLSIDGSEISESSATSSGGAVFVSNAETYLKDTSFTGNSTGNHGGAVYLAGGALTAEGNNSFTSNNAKNHGGAVYVVYYEEEQPDGTKKRIPAVLTMQGGEFTENTALGGGAVSIRSGCEAEFTGTVFDGNSVTGFSDKADGDGEGGGAVYVGFGTLSLNNVTATENTAKESTDAQEGTLNPNFGGAVDAYHSEVNVTGGTFSENSATSGGALFLVSSSLNASGAVFTENSSLGNSSSPVDSAIGGGAVYLNKSEAVITSCVLSGNNTNYYGGAIHSIASELTVDGNSQITGTSGATGSAVYLREKTTALIKDSTVFGNTSSSNGVVYINSGTLTMENVTANGNTAANGGVLYVSSSSAKAYISGGVWSENTANSGGALVTNDAKIEADGVTFSKNTANLGGAVYVIRGEFVADNTEFIENSAVKTADGSSGNGGAICMGAGTVTTSENAVFKKNTAENHGGAVYVSYANNADGTKTPGVLNASGGLFEENSASVGGAVSARTSCITVLNGTQLKSNTATSSKADGGGGAVFTNDNSLTLTDVTVTGNSSEYYGGAVTALNAKVTVNGDSTFSGNEGYTGIVFNFRGTTTASLDSVTVKDNIGTKGSGVVYITGSGDLSINKLTASGNKNINGGVIYASGSADVTVADSVFDGNTATQYGGAVDFRSSGTLTVTDSTFSSNSAVSGGALNHAGSGAAYIKGCTFEKNSASVSGGAMNLTGSGQVNISDDTVFSENTAPMAGAVYLDNGAIANISASSFNENTATGGNGGAIAIVDSSEEGKAATSLTLNTVTFDGNTASAKGGAISTDDASPNIVINAVSCVFTKNKALGAGGGAIEIQNGNCTSADGPGVNKLVFTNCRFTDNTSKTTGGAVEIRTSSSAKFDGIEATGNSAGSKQNGGVFYVTSVHSRLYLTGTVTQSGNTASSTGGFAYLYNSNYSNPPRIYTSHSSTAEWVSFVAGNKTSITFDVTDMP